MQRKSWLLSFVATLLIVGFAWSGTLRTDATPYGDGARIMPFIHWVNGMSEFSFWDPYRNGGYPILGNAEHFFFLSLFIDPSGQHANLLLNVALYLHLLAVAVVAWFLARKAMLSPLWSSIAAISIAFSEQLIVTEQSARFQALTLFLVLLLVHLIMHYNWKKKSNLHCCQFGCSRFRWILCSICTNHNIVV